MDERRSQSTLCRHFAIPHQHEARHLYEKVYCARGDMESHIKECQLDLFADRTSAATMRANQLRLWFAAMAYVLVCALRRIALRHTQFAQATCGIIRLKLFKIGALVSATSRTMTRASSSRSLHRDHNELSHQEYGTEHDPSHVMFRRRPSSPHVRRPRLETPASPAGVSLLASGIPLPLCPAYASATARRAPMVRVASR